MKGSYLDFFLYNVCIPFLDLQTKCHSYEKKDGTFGISTKN